MQSHSHCSSGFDKSYPQLNDHPTFKTVDSIYENRLRQFIDTGGQYHNLNLPKFYNRERLTLSNVSTPDETTHSGIWMKKWSAPGLSKPLFKDVIPSKLAEFKVCPANKAVVMSPKWSSHWIQVTIRIDQSWYDDVLSGKSKEKNEVLTFKFDAGCEAMVFGLDGCPLQGLTGDGERTECELPMDWFKASKIPSKLETVFYVECGCNSMFGGGGNDYGIRMCELVQYNYQAKALFYDFWVLSDAAREDSPPQKHKAREVCNKIMDVFDPDDVSSIDRCRKVAQEFLGQNVDSSLVFKEKKLNKFNAVYAIGNCHIDTAWLWDFATSKTKVARSWSSQLRLIEKYPEYVFVASAAQHFKWLVQYYPDLYKKIKKAAEGGRFIPLGGAWVENDTNLPSGEGLVRQFLLGQRYFENLFGSKSDIFWLPDSFGYSSQIPQICRLCEIPKFLTQKLSWNNINVFPENSFNWVGIDCSQVMVHMPPDNTYTADANYGDVKRSVINHKNLYDDQKGMLLYGKGDGGGGPTPYMVEKLRRCRGYANTAGGDFPQVELGCTVNDFFNDLSKDTGNGKKLPSWRGELYLEYHRGTYTTQAKVKNYMRTVEYLMHNVELYATIASIWEGSDYKYPLAKIEALWEDICLCQFHDVLPGSCINKVYSEDVWPMLANVASKETKLLKKALLKLGLSTTKDESHKHLVKLSSLPWKKSSIEMVENLPNYLLSLSQKVDANKYFIAFSGSSVLKPIASKIKYPSTITKTDDGLFVMVNSKLKALINSDGIVLQLYDLINNREIINDSLMKGGNQYVMFSDTPLNFPAWDTELFSLNKFKYVEKSTKCSIKFNGPLVSALEVEHKLSDTSKITTVISLEGLNDLSDTSALKFKCNVSWNEDYKFLKVQFPVNISADFASYETQFGITKRQTHYNTSWDVAKFECCMHKFVDFSDYNYGVSLVNNNKYGGSVHGNVMTLSLLRAPKYPDEKADIGAHSFEYEIFPHAGPLSAETVHAGWELNERMPPELYVTPEKKDTLKKLDDFITINGDEGVILSNVKRGEDDSDVDYSGGLMDKLPKKHVGSQTVVLRVYESLGGFSKATIKLDSKIKTVFKTNLLEEEKEEIKVSKDNEFSFRLRAFEIATFKVILA